MGRISVLILAGVLILGGCANKYYAEVDEYHYYFENSDANWVEALQPMLKNDSVYTFTEESSGRGYPYYHAFHSSEKVPVNMMVHPHYTVRQLVPYDQEKEYDSGSEKMIIQVFYENDSTLKSNIQVLKKTEEGDWERKVNLEDKYNLNKRNKSEVEQSVFMHIVRAMLK